MAQAFDPMRTIPQILAEHGPLDEDGIARRLQAGGWADADPTPDEMSYPAMQLPDDRWVWLPTLLTGRVFTHRVDADEVAVDALIVAPDLAPLTPLCEHEEYARLVDGSPVQLAIPDYDDELIEARGIAPESVEEGGLLLLPAGALEAVGAVAGDLVGLRLTEEGLALERVAAVGHADVGTALASALDGEDHPIFFSSAVWSACVADPAIFTEPLAPLHEIADDCGLASEGDWLAPHGFDFGRWHFEHRCRLLVEAYGIDPDDAPSLLALTELYARMSLLTDAAADEPSDEVSAALADSIEELRGEELLHLAGPLGNVLADPVVAEAFVSETIGTGREGADALALFADVLESRVERSSRVACRWLRAVALERAGDVDAAERELLAAESIDPDWPPPLYQLARIASDRGDAERGLSLLRRAGADPDDPLVELLERYRTAPRRDVGRNEPCWCGSGRKYKKCHLGREQLPLADRARWLYAKSIQHVLDSGWNDELVEAADERSRYAEDDPDALTEALEDPLVLDAVLFEGGGFAEFVQVRGSLLPDDERSLAEQWLLVDRSVFEVTEVRRGEGITLRDVRTGDTQEVAERTASRQLKPGQLICARVVPAGDVWQFFGGVEPVALNQRDRLIDLLDSEPDPVTLVAELSRRFAPPALSNTEGDPFAICEATVQVGDPDAIKDALDDTYDRVGDEPPRWSERVTVGGLERVRASLVLEFETLRVETNSEKRMDRVLATLGRLDPGMSVLDDSRRAVRDAREAAELALQVPAGDEGGGFDPDDPKVVAAFDEYVHEYEAKWLDMSIPALDGHTPRQAADDPTRRGDLIRLLDEFSARPTGRGVMSVDRLRAALGLG